MPLIDVRYEMDHFDPPFDRYGTSGTGSSGGRSGIQGHDSVCIVGSTTSTTSSSGSSCVNSATRTHQNNDDVMACITQ